MRNLLHRLHARLGDFWWYSLMVFCAARAADLLNAFVGLWLVPKYVDPAELGAVMPLTQFASFLAFPAAVFASTFRNELSGLAIHREFGKMKTLMRSVFIAAAVALFLAIVVSKFLLPVFLTRIRIAEGSLGFVILVSTFLGTVSPVYTNALQSLKKFRGFSWMHLLGAPIRLLAMVVTMPLRALTGYFVGQSAPTAFTILASVFCLRRELSVRAKPYWNREIVRRFAGLFVLFALGTGASAFCGLIESTVLRQRLPAIESAAYYMVTRFSDISAFLTTTLMFTLFPFTAELGAKGRDMRPIILKASAATLGFSAVLAAVFGLCGRQIMELLPHGAEYSPYCWAIPWLIGINFLTAVQAYYISADTSANRFRYLRWYLPLCLSYPALMLFVTGHRYFTAYLPAAVSAFLAEHNITSLSTMLVWITAAQLLKVILASLTCGKPAEKAAA